MKKPLREIMTDRIKHYGWLDWDYRRRDNVTEKALKLSRGTTEGSAAYEAWLNQLPDDEFLTTFLNVNEASDNLD